MQWIYVRLAVLCSIAQLMYPMTHILDETTPLITHHSSVHLASRPQWALCVHKLKQLPPELIKLISTFISSDDPVLPILLEYTGINAHEAHELIERCVHEHQVNPLKLFARAQYPALHSAIKRAWSGFNARVALHGRAIMECDDVTQVRNYIKQFLPELCLTDRPLEELSVRQLYNLTKQLRYALYYMQRVQETINTSNARECYTSGMLQCQTSTQGIMATTALYGLLLVSFVLYISLIDPAVTFDITQCIQAGLAHCLFSCAHYACFNSNCTDTLSKSQLYACCQQSASSNCTQIQAMFNKEHKGLAARLGIWAPLVGIVSGIVVLHWLYLISARLLKPTRVAPEAVQSAIAHTITHIHDQYARVEDQLRLLSLV